MIMINGYPIKYTKFPNGENKFDTKELDWALLTKPKNPYTTDITFIYSGDHGFVHLMFIKNYIDLIAPKNTVILTIPYMPYSRMDRTEGKAVFTLKYVANLINSLNFDRVIVYEPHSDVTMALIDRSVAIFYTFELLGSVEKTIGFDKDKDFLFFPDAGAQKRYSKLTDYKTGVGNKTRNFETGNIDKLEVVLHDEPKGGEKVIIIDDLCSYGGTFIKSANALVEKGFSDIYLLVTHCEDSIYKGDLLNHSAVKGVFTTDSIMTQVEHEKVIMYPVFQRTKSWLGGGK